MSSASKKVINYAANKITLSAQGITLTGGTELNGLYVDVGASSTLTYTNNTASTSIAFSAMGAPLITSSSTVANGYTLYLSGAPTITGGGTLTNSYALYVNSGISFFGGRAIFSAGAVGSPAIYFSSDSTSGLWRSAANNIDFTISGTNTAKISSSGVDLISGTNATPSLSFLSNNFCGLNYDGDNSVTINSSVDGSTQTTSSKMKLFNTGEYLIGVNSSPTGAVAAVTTAVASVSIAGDSLTMTYWPIGRNRYSFILYIADVTAVSFNITNGSTLTFTMPNSITVQSIFGIGDVLSSTTGVLSNTATTRVTIYNTTATTTVNVYFRLTSTYSTNANAGFMVQGIFTI